MYNYIKYWNYKFSNNGLHFEILRRTGHHKINSHSTTILLLEWSALNNAAFIEWSLIFKSKDSTYEQAKFQSYLVWYNHCIHRCKSTWLRYLFPKFLQITLQIKFFKLYFPKFHQIILFGAISTTKSVDKLTNKPRQRF